MIVKEGYKPIHPDEYVDKVLPHIDPNDYLSEFGKKNKDSWLSKDEMYKLYDWDAIFKQYSVSKNGFHRAFIVPMYDSMYPDMPRCIADYDKRTIPLISEKQYDKALALFKKGYVVRQVLAILDMVTRVCIAKRFSTNVNYDPNFNRLIEKGETYSFAAWMFNRNEENPRIWSQVMRNEFDWCPVPNSGKVADVIKFHPDNLSDTMDNIIKAVADGQLDNERAKTLTEIIIGSYNVRQIENK